MNNLDIGRRELIAAASLIGAVPAWAANPRPHAVDWKHQQSRFPHGVASGDPTHDSVILWTRCAPGPDETECSLTLEVAADAEFRTILSAQLIDVNARSDWTCRVLVAGLKPDRIYWFRFTDEHGAGSRIGRTRTAPHPNDPRPVSFAFVSCQNLNLGPLLAWRRMNFEDRARSEIEFVLHLGDFVYDTVWYPEDRPQGYFDRTINGIQHYPTGERHGDFHVPTTLEDYRLLYRTYLLDPDLQEARARWPFVAIWDNGEFSNDGWQGLERFGATTMPAQTRKVAANQAWFEYLPSRARTVDGGLAEFRAPAVSDESVQAFGPDGLGLEENNLAAINSLIGYRRQGWGSNVDLILTDQRSYRSEDYTAAPLAKTIASKQFPQMVPFETLQMIDAGASWNDGHPPAELQFGDGKVDNFRKEQPPRTLLGTRQRAWLIDQLQGSKATWKVWANTVATLDMRADPQNLPAGSGPAWPGRGYAGFPRTDHSTAYVERGAIYDAVEQAKIAGFVTLSGDRHSFWAGYSAKQLPPEPFRPVGLSFVTGSISSPGMAEAFQYTLPREHPLRSLFLTGEGKAALPTMNLLLQHGVRACLDFARDGNLAEALKASNPGNAPHVEFVDMAGHGYGIVRASARAIEVEFVCVPRPIADDGAADGGPMRYRVTHRANLWAPGERPKLEQVHMAGDAGLSA